MTALNKVWVGGTTNFTTDYSVAANWKPISLRNATYRWLASGSGTSEYYLDLAGGGDPGISEPANILGNAVALVAGTAGSLTAGQWDFADNDTLGYSTIYVRLADSTDPDSKAIGYVTLSQAPVATDNVRVPASSSYAISAGLDQSAVAIGAFFVEEGYSRSIGTSDQPLAIDPDSFSFNGSGVAYFDLGAANIVAKALGTASAAAGARGLYLVGSNLSVLDVQGGSVGLASRPGETSTVANVRVSGGNASLWLGAGVTATTIRHNGGNLALRCGATTVVAAGGEVTTEETGSIATFNVLGGNVYPNSTGTITTLNIDGGFVDFTKSGAARTVTTVKQNPPSSLRYDPSTVTFTNKSAPDQPTSFTASAA